VEFGLMTPIKEFVDVKDSKFWDQEGDCFLDRERDHESKIGIGSDDKIDRALVGGLFLED